MHSRHIWKYFVSLCVFLGLSHGLACSLVPQQYLWNEWKNIKSPILQSLLKQGVKTNPDNRLVLYVPNWNQPIEISERDDYSPENAFVRKLLEVTKWDATIVNEVPWHIKVGTLKIPLLDGLRDFQYDYVLGKLQRDLPRELMPMFYWCPMGHPTSWYTHTLKGLDASKNYFVITNVSGLFVYDVATKADFRLSEQKLLFYAGIQSFINADNKTGLTPAILIQLTNNIGVNQKYFDVILPSSLVSIGKKQSYQR